MQSKIKFANREISRIGQGTWHMGETHRKEVTEIKSLRTGIDSGMVLIDTAEMYGNGGSEKVIGKAIAPYKRDSLFLVSKVYPHNSGRSNIFQSCENSLRRLNTDYLDLYLLHWRGRVPLEETVQCMQELVEQGKIKNWGVSNFDLDDMEDLWKIPNGKECMTNQVLYHMGSRGIEYDLLPWMRRHNIPVMAYCPLAQAGTLRHQLTTNPIIIKMAEDRNISVMQLLLAFILSKPDMLPIPKAGNPVHVKQNAEVLNIELTETELDLIDREFPAPTKKMPLDIE